MELVVSVYSLQRKESTETHVPTPWYDLRYDQYCGCARENEIDHSLMGCAHAFRTLKNCGFVCKKSIFETLLFNKFLVIRAIFN